MRSALSTQSGLIVHENFPDTTVEPWDVQRLSLMEGACTFVEYSGVKFVQKDNAHVQKATNGGFTSEQHAVRMVHQKTHILVTSPSCNPAVIAISGSYNYSTAYAVYHDTTDQHDHLQWVPQGHFAEWGSLIIKEGEIRCQTCITVFFAMREGGFTCALLGT